MRHELAELKEVAGSGDPRRRRGETEKDSETWGVVRALGGSERGGRSDGASMVRDRSGRKRAITPLPLHRWDVTPREAVAIQRELAARVDRRRRRRKFRLVAAADVSVSKESDTLFAGIVVCRADDFSVVERVGVVSRATFPYVPGLLSFRECPALLEAIRRLEHRPDVVLIDGQGFAHPRRFGIASHFGVLVDLPTVGCAKSVLVGEYEGLGREAGSRAPLVHRGEVVGMAVRTRTGVTPVYVSVGHKIDLGSAVEVVLRTAVRYRLPEPARLAHQHAGALRREHHVKREKRHKIGR